MSPKKIALVSFRLSGGGADRVMSVLSNYFHKKGLDVHIIIFHNEIGYSHSGTVFNLGKLKSDKNNIFNKLNRFYYFNKYIKKQKFDFIIDFRFRIRPIQELLISKIIYKTKTIYTIHSSELNTYIPDYSPLAKLIYKRCFKLVAITHEIQTAIEVKHQLRNVCTIKNPIDIVEIKNMANEDNNINFQYIIAVGEYENNIKQFDKLIEVYSKTQLPNKEISLVIIGKGKLKEHLLKVAKRCNVTNYVHLLGFKYNPYKYIKGARFLVLTSKYEGLPMAIIESLACGTPVISYDCPTGPREVIIHKENGLLIENQNTDKLKEGMDLFVYDEKLYLHCKKGAISSINKFSIERIGIQWLNLMKNEGVKG